MSKSHVSTSLQHDQVANDKVLLPRRKFLKDLSLIGIASTGVFSFLAKCTSDDKFAPSEMDNLIHNAFRLCDHKSLLNLEFYFINCRYHKSTQKITAKYGPYENYMVVRLPQQHIEEQYFPEGFTDNPPQAVTYISGFSYLVFRILFPEKGIFSLLKDKPTGDAEIKLTKEDLLDWGDESRFRLVVRQDLSESLFDLSKQFIKPVQKENHYPFQTTEITQILKGDTSRKDTFVMNNIPKVFGDPVTAIELPWRLIISPKLPSSLRYKFDWTISNTSTKTPGLRKLWTATLSISQRQNYAGNNQKATAEGGNKDELSKVFEQMELMILGTPDLGGKKFLLDEFLPRDYNRVDIVELYIKLKIMAKTQKLTFSPLGATADIAFKNDRIEESLKIEGRDGPVNIIDWNQVISLGRDERVEVSTLVLEADYGHKMACLQISKRKLKYGSYAMVLRTEIVPLDDEKDFSLHETQITSKLDADKSAEVVSKFNSPFRKISFIELKPKELLMPYDTVLGARKSFNPTEVNLTETIFAFEGVDWHGLRCKFFKKINVLPLGAVLDLRKTDENGAVILKADVTRLLSTNDVQSTPATKVQLDKDAYIPIYSIDSIRQKFALSNIDKKKAELDDLIHQIDKLKKEVVTRLVLIPEEIKKFLTPLSDMLEGYLLSFGTIITDQYRSGKATLETIKADLLTLNITKIALFIIRVDMCDAGSAFRMLLNRWIDEIKAIFSTPEAFLNLILSPNGNTELDYFVAAINPDPKLKDKFDKLIAAGSKEEQSSLSTSFIHEHSFLKILSKWEQEKRDLIRNPELLLKALTDITLIPALKSFLEFISMNAPDWIDKIEQIKRLLAQPTTLVDNIRVQLTLPFDIEKIAADIPGLILLGKQKIGFAVKEKLDSVRQKYIDELQERSGQIKKSISELESDYMIFAGGLRETEDKIFDFFSEYAIIPQMQVARVYVNALNKLVEQEIPINIAFAADYFKNQVDDVVFEVSQNAAMVFARVREDSREAIKGVMQKISEQLPGFNMEIPAHFLTYARNPSDLLDSTLKQINASLPDITNETLEDLRKYGKDLVFVSEGVREGLQVMNDLQQIDPVQYFKGLGAKLFGSIGIEYILDVGFDLPRITELPDSIIYQMSTNKLKEFRGDLVAFKPHVGGESRMELLVTKGLKGDKSVHTYVHLNNFSISVIVGGAVVLEIFFEKFIISTKVEAVITQVKLGGPLEFIADLAKNFMSPGEGIKVRPGPTSLLIEYKIDVPGVSTPAFAFKNLQIAVQVVIPYDPRTLKEISFGFRVNSNDDKFLIAASGYGGGGSFLMRSTPSGIECLDIAIEMGAYASINIGVGSGEVYLFFGFWFVCEKLDNGESNIRAVAYVICSGSATVFGFITIGVSILISLIYEKRGQTALFFGEAVVTYSVKIAFFKKSFSIRYRKEIAGSSNGNGTNSMQTGVIGLGNIPTDNLPETEQENVSFADVFPTEEDFFRYLECFQ